MPMSLLTALFSAALAAGPSDATRTRIEAQPELRPLVDVLTHANDVSLLSINPSTRSGKDGKAECSGWCVYEWEVYGAIRLRDSDDLRAIREVLTESLQAPEDTSMAMCFMPRHSVHLS